MQSNVDPLGSIEKNPPRFAIHRTFHLTPINNYEIWDPFLCQKFPFSFFIERVWWTFMCVFILWHKNLKDRIFNFFVYEALLGKWILDQVIKVVGMCSSRLRLCRYRNPEYKNITSSVQKTYYKKKPSKNRNSTTNILSPWISSLNIFLYLLVECSLFRIAIANIHKNENKAMWKWLYLKGASTETWLLEEQGSAKLSKKRTQSPAIPR